MRPGGCTSRMIESAVTDLPLPDSPTSASVSPSRTLKLTSSTAMTVRLPLEKPVVRFSTSKRAQPRHLSCLLLSLRYPQRSGPRATLTRRRRVLAEHAAHGVGDLAEGRVRLHG